MVQKGKSPASAVGLAIMLAFTAQGAHARDGKTGLAQYDFSYDLSGAREIRPVQVFDDGESTYFQFQDLDNVPAIISGDAQSAPVPFEIKGRFVVVKGVYTRYRLQLGQFRAEVQRSQSAAPDKATATASYDDDIFKKHSLEPDWKSAGLSLDPTGHADVVQQVVLNDKVRTPALAPAPATLPPPPIDVAAVKAAAVQADQADRAAQAAPAPAAERPLAEVAEPVPAPSPRPALAAARPAAEPAPVEAVMQADAGVVNVPRSAVNVAPARLAAVAPAAPRQGAYAPGADPDAPLLAPLDPDAPIMNRLPPAGAALAAAAPAVQPAALAEAPRQVARENTEDARLRLIQTTLDLLTVGKISPDLASRIVHLASGADVGLPARQPHASLAALSELLPRLPGEHAAHMQARVRGYDKKHRVAHVKRHDLKVALAALPRHGAKAARAATKRPHAVAAARLSRPHGLDVAVAMPAGLDAPLPAQQAHAAVRVATAAAPMLDATVGSPLARGHALPAADKAADAGRQTPASAPGGDLRAPRADKAIAREDDQAPAAFRPEWQGSQPLFTAQAASLPPAMARAALQPYAAPRVRLDVPANQRLSVALKNMLAQDSWHLDWQADHDFNVFYPYSITGDSVEEVLQKTLAGYGLTAVIYNVNRVISIRPIQTAKAS